MRQNCVGVRSMLYGSMLGLLGVAVLGTVAFKYMGYSSLQDLRPSPDQEAGLIQRWLQPYKERIQASVFEPLVQHYQVHVCCHDAGSLVLYACLLFGDVFLLHVCCVVNVNLVV